MADVPRATYRLQLRAEFGFADAAAVAGYLARLGVSHLYLSPVLQAAPGSTHGYDVVDHRRLSDDLGGADGFAVLERAAAEAGVGIVVDVVPNHMATGRENAWWWDVLENGPSSLYAAYFDIDWDPPEAKLRQKVLVPVLGDHYGRVLEAGELGLRRDGGSFVLTYFDHELPVSPRTVDELLGDAADAVANDELASLAAAFSRLPPASATDRASVSERHRDKEILRARLDALCRAEASVARAVDAEIARVAGDPDRLDALVQRQNYRLAYWRVAGHELDYRRFFDIPSLIALRAENPVVFDDTHALLLDLIGEGRVDGLRIDHPDGLRDPVAYLARLRDTSGGAWVVVEKILEHHEPLRRGWAAAGTTGYDFLNVVGGLFVDPAGEEPLTELYARVTGDRRSFGETALEAKREIMTSALAADVERLTAVLAEVCEARRRYRDYTRVDLRDAVREALAGLDVYRTYVVPGRPADPADVRAVATALDRVRARRPDIDEDLLRLLERLLLGREAGRREAEFAERFQQVSGPVMAKGVEDTAFYRYLRLSCLNEVGGDPGRFGTRPEDFHAHNARAAADWPATMLTTSTHDTKRSEDVRARLCLLSEIPGRWAAAVDRWMAMNERHKTEGMPDRRTEYLLYQTLVGAHPLDADRAVAYMEKATREAKTATSWTAPNAEYDAALRSFVEVLLADPAFTGELAAFVAPLVEPGRVTSLAQTLLKLTSPGVPDIYQGCEVWDLSLVDPDNRRPVAYDHLDRRRREADAATPAELLARADAGLPKMAVTLRALGLRRRLPDAFAPGAAYVPLAAEGERAERVVAYRRGEDVVVVAPRLVMGLAAGWGDTRLTLPPGRWTDELTGLSWKGEVDLAAVLGGFPVGLLVRTPAGG